MVGSGLDKAESESESGSADQLRPSASYIYHNIYVRLTRAWHSAAMYCIDISARWAGSLYIRW